MQTQPLNYAPLVTVIKYGLLFGLVSQADVAEWVAQIAPADPFLLQLSRAGNTAQLQNLINSRRVAGANALTLRVLLGLLYHKLNSQLISVPEAAEATKAINEMHLFDTAEQDHIRNLMYQPQGSLPDRFLMDLDVDLLNFLSFYEAYTPRNFARWPDINQPVNQHLQVIADDQSTALPQVQTRQQRKRLAIAVIILAGIIALFAWYALIAHVPDKSKDSSNSVWIFFPLIGFYICKLVYTEVRRRWPS